MMLCPFCFFSFFFNDTATTEIYTLSLHDALPISMSGASDGPRELLISTGTSDAGDVRVAVRDSGPGLTPAALERLFEPFYRSEEHTSELQSPDHLVCRLLLEKKKNKQIDRQPSS